MALRNIHSKNWNHLAQKWIIVIQDPNIQQNTDSPPTHHVCLCMFATEKCVCVCCCVLTDISLQCKIVCLSVCQCETSHRCSPRLCVSLSPAQCRFFFAVKQQEQNILSPFPASPSRQARTTQTEAQMPPPPLMCEILNTTWEARLWSSRQTRPQRGRINTRWLPIKRQDTERLAALIKKRIKINMWYPFTMCNRPSELVK